MNNVGDLLVQIDAADIEPDETEVSSADGFDVICTYNWSDSKTPILYVPGMSRLTSNFDQPNGNKLRIVRRPSNLDSKTASREHTR